jgi:glucose/galactose transporter
MILFSPLPDIDAEEDTSEADQNNSHKSNIFQFPQLVLGVIALFLYVGVEVMAGDTIGTYGQSQGIALSVAKNFTAYTLVAMVIGYILGIATIPKLISQSKALGLSAIIGVIFSIVAISTHGYTSVLFIALLGLANALMWPAIWPLAINGLGKYTKTGSAMLIMAIAGGALLPLLYGRLADIDRIGPRQAYWIMVPCYLFILFYSIRGHKVSCWSKSS